MNKNNKLINNDIIFIKLILLFIKYLYLQDRIKLNHT